MKVKALSFLTSICFAFSCPVFSADIPITGPDIVTGSGEFTFYAHPSAPIAPGTTYTWHPGSGTIVAQNTDPAAGPLYVTIDYPPILAQDAVEISDNHGNSGIHYIEIWGWAIAAPQNPFGAMEGELKEGANHLRATCMYERHEAIGAGEKKRTMKTQLAIA